MGPLERLGITLEELEEAMLARPSLRGIIIGYLAERKMCDIWFPKQKLTVQEDHDRSAGGDRVIVWKGVSITIEVKSLDTPSVVQSAAGWNGTYQINASDKRKVVLPNGLFVETNCLVVGGFDLLAISLYEFGQTWRFAFIKNGDLPRSPFRKYTPDQQKYLLKSANKITWPLAAPYRDEPTALLDEIAASKSH